MGLVLTVLVVAACATPADAPLSTSAATPVPTLIPSPTPTVVPFVPTPTATPVPTLLIAQAVVEIPGRRVSLDGVIDLVADQLPASTVGRTLTIRFDVPRSTGDGRTQPRGVLTFGKWIIDENQLENYIDIPTTEGPLRLHLHRDGTLRLVEDDGSYT